MGRWGTEGAKVCRFAPACVLAACGWLGTACERDTQSTPATKSLATPRTALAPGELCPALSYITLSVTVMDRNTNDPVCDAEVTAVDDKGQALRLRPAPDGCALHSYDGREAMFTVSARKPGYAEASERVAMRKFPCQFSAPAVHLALRRSGEHPKD
jgi:hypothetical protein